MSDCCLTQLGNFSAAISWREQVNFPGQPVFALSPYDGKKFIKLMFFVYIYAGLKIKLFVLVFNLLKMMRSALY